MPVASLALVGPTSDRELRGGHTVPRWGLRVELSHAKSLGATVCADLGRRHVFRALASSRHLGQRLTVESG